MSRVKYIHVAGTKGKGTVCLYTEHLIRTYQSRNGMDSMAGRVGCLTSPHLSSIRERIRIDGAPITEASFAKYFWRLWDLMQSDEHMTHHSTSPPMPGYPSFITLLAFYIFASESVQLAIIETGIGGEKDSTNALSHPIATGVTELGLDHVNKLGNTLESIAWHKGGIFKRGSPAFSVPQASAAAAVLQQRAIEKNVSLGFIDDSTLVRSRVEVVPNAPFQRLNASLAVALFGAYLESSSPGRQIEPDEIRCLADTELPGKFELIRHGNVSWVLSSAHNEMSVRVACQEFIRLVEK